MEVGFATFYLNRCNRSGVLNAGPIGGLKQDGNYKIDVRFNKRELRRKVEKIGLFRDRIKVFNCDGVEFLRQLGQEPTFCTSRSLVYMDPPYFRKASTLYEHFFKDEDHVRLATYLQTEAKYRWILSYDDNAMVRRLYSGRKDWIKANYTVREFRRGRELIISSHACRLPDSAHGRSGVRSLTGRGKG